MVAIKNKIIKILNRELDNILKEEEQEQIPKQNPIFENFDINFAKELDKHNKFMDHINKSLNSLS